MCDICRTINRKQLANAGLNGFDGTHQPNWQRSHTVAVGQTLITTALITSVSYFLCSVTVWVRLCHHACGGWMSSIIRSPFHQNHEQQWHKLLVRPWVSDMVLTYLKRNDKIPIVNDDCYCFFLLLGLWQTFGTLCRTMQHDMNPCTFCIQGILDMRRECTLDRTPRLLLDTQTDGSSFPRSSVLQPVTWKSIKLSHLEGNY